MDQLEPTLSASLDPHLQQESDKRERVANGKYLEKILKLSGLFAKHLVIREHHLLDHLATRDFFIRLSADESALREAVEYLTSSGKDSLGLGPVVLCSEPLDSADPFLPFPLEQVLRRRLGIDEHGYAPWEMSSIFDLSSLSDANAAIHGASPSDRLNQAFKHLGPAGSYPRYLDIVSRIWDARAGVNRIPWGRGDFAARLKETFADVAQSKDEDSARTAQSLLSMIKGGKIYLPGEEGKPLIRSTVNPWLRTQAGGYKLQWRVNLADFEAFVLSFPARRGWVSSDDPEMIGCWKGPEANSQPRGKRPLGDAIIEPAKIDTGGPIVLDELTFRDLATLRSSQSFQDSLDRVRAEWQCHQWGALQKALCDHVELIYRELGLKQRSSRKRKEGPSASVDIVTAATGTSTGLLAAHALQAGSISFYLAGALIGPAAVTIKHLWTWHKHETGIARQLRELARQVASSAKQ